jgi:hypothetical protein
MQMASNIDLTGDDVASSIQVPIGFNFSFFTPTKQPALRLSRTKNLHFAKATFPGFSAFVFFRYTVLLAHEILESLLPISNIDLTGDDVASSIQVPIGFNFSFFSQNKTQL